MSGQVNNVDTELHNQGRESSVTDSAASQTSWRARGPRRLSNIAVIGTREPALCCFVTRGPARLARRRKHVDDRDRPSSVRPDAARSIPVRNTAEGTVIFVVIVGVGMVWVFVVEPWVADRSDKRRRRQSAAFRSRWQHVPLWQVPHNELAAEAKRCKGIIETLEAQARSGKVDQPALAELTAQITWYRSAMDAVQQAMDYVAAKANGHSSRHIDSAIGARHIRFRINPGARRIGSSTPRSLCLTVRPGPPRQ